MTNKLDLYLFIWLIEFLYPIKINMVISINITNLILVSAKFPSNALSPSSDHAIEAQTRMN